MTYTNHGRPGGRIGLAALALLVALGVGACDELDPTQVENPATTEDDLAQAEEPVSALMPGLRSQFARTIGASVTTTAVVSDDYSIHGTGIQKTMDFPRTIDPNNVNSTGSGSAHSIYWQLQELRALADFVLDVIAPEDERATDAQLAEAHYYRGMALLIQSENFVAVPVEEDGTPVPAAQLRTAAIGELLQTVSLGGPFELPARAALARAYRWEGNAADAEAQAQAVLAADPDFLFQVGYDAASLTNNPWAFLVARQLQEMQPLPRLDFLDPKYVDRESPIAVAKAEEMHLILAEIDLGASADALAAQHLRDAVELALSRPVVSFTDNDPRGNFDLSIRPRDEEIVIRADADSPFREGLVRNRAGGTVDVPVVSGTSLDADSVALLVGDPLLHAFNLARQEILFLEGRRMADLGIRLPIMQRELETNPNIADGDTGTAVFVPAWIPAGDDMDLFSPMTLYEGDLFDEEQVLVGTETTILWDMNRVLTENRIGPLLN